MPQCPVNMERGDVEIDGHALRQDDLHDIAVDDVLLDALDRAHERLAAEFRIEIRFIRRRVSGGDGKSRHRCLEALRQFFEFPCGTFARAPVIGIDVVDQQQFASQVVENDEFIGLKQKDIGRIQRIGRARITQLRLDEPDRVIAEVADEAAAESGQIFSRRHSKTSLVSLDEGERVLDRRLFDRALALAHGDAVSTNDDRARRGQADDGITAPFFAAFDRF